jgi:hypothetical protein
MPIEDFARIAAEKQELLERVKETGRGVSALSDLLDHIEDKFKVVAEVWRYLLRLSARVVRGYAPGRYRKLADGTLKLIKPPRWVVITSKSPINVELSFENFISSLDEPELEDAYKTELIALARRLVDEHRREIAAYLNMLEVELPTDPGEWDFGTDGRSPAGTGISPGSRTSDFYELNVYAPSGWENLIADGYYEHEV